MRLSKNQKIIISAFFFTIATGQCIDNTEEERRIRSRKGQKIHKTKRVRSRRGREADVLFEPWKEDD